MAIPGDKEEAAIRAASAVRGQRICLEDEGTDACGCDVPVTREQVRRLRAFAAQHPERAFIFSEAADMWMTALRAFLSPGAEDEDRVAAWACAPFILPAGADLRHCGDLGGLLDMLGAPPTAAMS